jgi:acyl dehydratase
VADHEVTLGEVHRLILAVQKDLRDMRGEVIGRREYEADQKGIGQRFQDLSREITDLEASIAAVDTKLDSKVDAIEESLAAAERERRQNNSRWTLALVMAVVSPVLAIVVSVLLRGGV